MSLTDVPGAVALQRACFPEPFPVELLWSNDHLERHLQVFPDGQFVAKTQDQIVGSCSNCLVSEETWNSHMSWEETVGGPFLDNHNPNGSTLYGLDVSVHPSWRGKGIMRKFYNSRFELVRQLGLTRYGTAVRIPDFDSFHAENPDTSPEDYVREVAAGRVIDRTLTPMLRVGLKLEGVIRNYMEDKESHNAAAVLEWRP